MNRYKQGKNMKLIRSHGKQQMYQFGQILSVDELMGWFGLKEYLMQCEQARIERE
jgi:hypothetical protein